MLFLTNLFLRSEEKTLESWVMLKISCMPGVAKEDDPSIWNQSSGEQKQTEIHVWGIKKYILHLCDFKGLFY